MLAHERRNEIGEVGGCRERSGTSDGTEPCARSRDRRDRLHCHLCDSRTAVLGAILLTGYLARNGYPRSHRRAFYTPIILGVWSGAVYARCPAAGTASAAEILTRRAYPSARLHFAHPALQNRRSRGSADQLERSRCSSSPLPGGSHAAQQIGPRRVEQVIAFEASLAASASGARAPARAVHLGDRHGPVQRTMETAHTFENIIQPKDLTPVRIFGPRRLTMHAESLLEGERFQVRYGAPPRLSAGLAICCFDPAAAILLVEQDEIAGLIEAGKRA